jgi:hypothetical protein
MSAQERRGAFSNGMKTTGYFDAIRRRSDRITIEERWIESVVSCPEREQNQLDGRIRRWGRIAEAKNRWLRVVVLADGVTVHNAFFDRRFRP